MLFASSSASLRLAAANTSTSRNWACAGKPDSASKTANTVASSRRHRRATETTLASKAATKRVAKRMVKRTSALCGRGLDPLANVDIECSALRKGDERLRTRPILYTIIRNFGIANQRRHCAEPLWKRKRGLAGILRVCPVGQFLLHGDEEAMGALRRRQVHKAVDFASKRYLAHVRGPTSLLEVPERQSKLPPDPASKLDRGAFEDMLLDCPAGHQSSLEIQTAHLVAHQVLFERGEKLARLRQRGGHRISRNALRGRSGKSAACCPIVGDDVSSWPRPLNLQRGDVLLQLGFCIGLRARHGSEPGDKEIRCAKLEGHLLRAVRT